MSPLAFEPDVHRAVWGEEEWLASAHPSAPGRILGGGGKTLRDVCPKFPLIIKTIRAESRLSVQVHPNERTATVCGGEPKTEMWCVLRPGPIYAGFRPGVSMADVERAAGDGSFEDMLVKIDAKAGECYLIPGGLVHSIGEGTSVYEVQQSSDTTFRLYDWGRVGSDGKPRALHVKEALAAMDLSIPSPEPHDGISCAYFDFSTIEAGPVWPVGAWRALYTPSSRRFLLLPPGAGVEAEDASFLTTVRAMPGEMV